MRTISTCLVNTRVNTFPPGPQLTQIPYNKYFHISNFYVSRRSPKQVFSKFLKIDKKTPVLESFSNKAASLYPETLLKEKTLIQELSDEFCDILLKTSFSLNSSWRLLTEKYFSSRIAKSLLKKEKRRERAGMKINDIRRKKSLNSTYLKSSYPLTIHEFLCFSFLWFL